MHDLCTQHRGLDPQRHPLDVQGAQEQQQRRATARRDSRRPTLPARAAACPASRTPAAGTAPPTARSPSRRSAAGARCPARRASSRCPPPRRESPALRRSRFEPTATPRRRSLRLRPEPTPAARQRPGPRRRSACPDPVPARWPERPRRPPRARSPAPKNRAERAVVPYDRNVICELSVPGSARRSPGPPAPARPVGRRWRGRTADRWALRPELRVRVGPVAAMRRPVAVRTAESSAGSGKTPADEVSQEHCGAPVRRRRQTRSPSNRPPTGAHPRRMRWRR